MKSSINSSEILDQFLNRVSEQGLELYPAQEEAILALYEGSNVILNTPTGSGKSLVAQSLHFLSIKQGQTSYYTCPIKALVNEKFRALCKEFGPEKVGMITGDATVNSDASIICCTAEILSNVALREGDRARIHDVIMDEFHYYSDRDRGVAWQIPLLTMPQTRFLLMSATLGDTAFFEKALSQLNGRSTELIRSLSRPVPLEYEYSEVPVQEKLLSLVEQARAPVYIVHFSQRECAESAQDFMSLNFCTKEEKREIAALLETESFDSPYGKELQRFLRHGTGVHHAGLLPKYRLLVEKLAQKGLLKIICGTDTLGVGVNIPIRTVLFTKLCKYDGEKSTLLSVRDFHQISGRAGRKGFDDRGFVVVQAPEHVIENKKIDEKMAAGQGKKAVKRKPPERGFVPWDRSTLQRLMESLPEPLVPQFQLSHGMLLNVLSRSTEDGCRAMAQLIRTSHTSAHVKKILRKRAFELFRSLVERSIIEFVATSTLRKRIQLNVDLQQDFSLNQSLSLYLLDTLALLDTEDPDYALNVLSLVESILENPEVILRKQVDRLKTEKLAQLKAEGVEYDDRMAELEKIEHPKPLRDFIYNSFNAFSQKHPWVGVENIRPKSVARELYEQLSPFSDYIREYELPRAEGVLLRYLSEAYKVLVQTVPESDKTDALFEMTAFFRDLLKNTDSSLVDEWERMRDPNFQTTKKVTSTPQAPRPIDVLKNDREFKAQMRNSVFKVLRALSTQQWDQMKSLVQAAPDAIQLETLIKTYHDEHSTLDISPTARRPELLKIDFGAAGARLEQTVSDAEGPVNWVLSLELDLEGSLKAQAPRLSWLSFEKI